MKNILMLYELMMPSVEILGNQMGGLCKRCKGDLRIINIQKVSEKDIQKADIVICVRGETPLMLGCLKYAETLGKKRMFFLDDDLKDVPKELARYPKRKKWLIKCIETCEILLTTNKLIADEYRELTKEGRTVLINTVVEESEINNIKENDNNIKIVYAAAEKHVIFFEKYIRPIMESLYEQYGDMLEFYFIGVNPCFSGEKYVKQIHCIPGMPFKQYTEYMRATRFDIGLAPLESNHFTARKYFNKYVEYAKDGIFGIYSACMPYQLVVEDGKNGYLADNTPRDWYNAICRAIENKEERIKCIENSQKYLRKYHSSEEIYAKLIEEIPELLYFEKNIRGEKAKIKYKFRHKYFKLFESLYLTIMSIRHNGVRNTIKKITSKWRRKNGTD